MIDCACFCHIPGHAVIELCDEVERCCPCFGLRLGTRWPPEGLVADDVVPVVSEAVGLIVEQSERVRRTGKV